MGQNREQMNEKERNGGKSGACVGVGGMWISEKK